MAASLNSDLMRAALKSLLPKLPEEWRGTTFKNSNLLSREGFSANVINLISARIPEEITTADLTSLGNAEDYLRVSSNISTLLELALSVERGYNNVSQVFTFASTAMPIVAVLYTSRLPVHLFVGEGGRSPFDAEQLELLKLLDCHLTVHATNPVDMSGHIVLSAVDVDVFTNDFIDGFIFPNVLYIEKPDRIVPSEILVIRKRMSTPLTTPAAEEMLQRLCGLEVSANTKEARDSAVREFYEHLQVLSGVEPNCSAYPVCFTAGLPAINALWTTLIFEGGADVVMASTAYGGSSQLTDLMTQRSANFRKHTFDIMGTIDITESIRGALNLLAANASNLMPTTVLFVEIPTNPDMKVPIVEELAEILLTYESSTRKKVLLLVDTTFAPGSRVMEKMKIVAPTLATMTFISMSKSVSRGMTTAGTLVAGPATESCALLHSVNKTTDMLDTRAKKDQLVFLTENHVGVEDRCQRAYSVAVAVGNALIDVVRQSTGGYEMPLAFVTPEQAAVGFTTSTFSFNLPALPGGSAEANEALAQRFVDIIATHKEIKPCVSFGQDNGLIYATVPATSTQGAIKAEDKAKQAVGGVQLVRLSFPPSCDVERVCEIISDAVKTCYRA